MLDATELSPELQEEGFDKCFSNAAMHWILRPEKRRAQFFRGVRNALKPGGVFAFELGGMGNVTEVCRVLCEVKLDSSAFLRNVDAAWLTLVSSDENCSPQRHRKEAGI